MKNDSYLHKGMRKKMLESLRIMGINDEEVLTAMDAVPRHWFLDEGFLNHAYENKAFQIGCGQTISHPYTVAFQTSALAIKKGEKVLEIGSGCGYQTAVLFKMGAKVFSVERQRPLYLNTKKVLQSLGFRAQLFYGDGYKGLPLFAPFHKIIVTAGAPYIPEDLVNQLLPHGKMIIPVGEGKQIMTLIEKDVNGKLTYTELGAFAFVPMLQDKAW